MAAFRHDQAVTKYSIKQKVVNKNPVQNQNLSKWDKKCFFVCIIWASVLKVLAKLVGGFDKKI